MEYALKERIGKPELFTGRREELAYFLNWINDIKEEKSQSTALLARRKMGKTTIMERLFNITFAQNSSVIPFYYEMKEINMWTVDFCVEFFLTFIYQYIAFKSRKVEYINPFSKNSLERAKQDVIKEGQDFLVELIESVEYSVKHESIGSLWETVRTSPHTVAARQNEFIVQMIDEFQFLNSMIYRDKRLKDLKNDMAGGYLSTAESKIAPLLVSFRRVPAPRGWVGWLTDESNTMLPTLFNYKFLKDMPQDEAVEMVFKHSRFFDVPVAEEIVYLISEISEGSPFYISSIMRSEYGGKDLTTKEGLGGTLEFETLDNRGNIKITWMEYVSKALTDVNNRNAKRIVLHLLKHKDRELTRKELLDDLKLDMTDADLERKMNALVKADIIQQGETNFDYRCVCDNIFDKVFRGVYQDEIEHLDAGELRKGVRRTHPLSR